MTVARLNGLEEMIQRLLHKTDVSRGDVTALGNYNTTAAPTLAPDDDPSHLPARQSQTPTGSAAALSPHASRRRPDAASVAFPRKQAAMAAAPPGDSSDLEHASPDAALAVGGVGGRGAGGDRSTSRPGSAGSLAVSDRSGAAAADTEGASRGQRPDVAEGLASGMSAGALFR